MSCDRDISCDQEEFAQRVAARKLLGRRVRFAHRPDDAPMLVTGVNLADGMVSVEEFGGCEFAPHVFVVVEEK